MASWAGQAHLVSATVPLPVPMPLPPHLPGRPLYLPTPPQAVATGHAAIASMCRQIEAWAAEVGRPKRTEDLLLPPEGLDERVRVGGP